jgi:hypothetical protein
MRQAPVRFFDTHQTVREPLAKRSAHDVTDGIMQQASDQVSFVEAL